MLSFGTQDACPAPELHEQQPTNALPDRDSSLESSRPGSECACAPRACELWKCMSPSSISRLARFCRQLSYCVPVQVPTPREESHDVRAWARVRATRTRLRTRYLLRIVGTVKDLLIVAAVDCIRARAQRKLAAHQYP